MTQTANTNEAPLTWTSKPEWGSAGNTYRAEVTLDNGDVWKFAVDQPRKGYWVARGWVNGDMKFYREDHTMKGAKAQSQAHANFASTNTCGECRVIGGHKQDCGTMDEVADWLTKAPAEPVDEADTDSSACIDGNGDEWPEHDESGYSECRRCGAELTSDALTIKLVDEGAAVLAALNASEAVRRMSDIVKALTPTVRIISGAFRRMATQLHHSMSTCGCPTPLHTMRCGLGGRAVIVRRPVLAVHKDAQPLIAEVRTMEFKAGA